MSAFRTGDKCMFINGFDFVLHDKPCIYYNYEQPQLKGIRDIGQNYKYVHLEYALYRRLCFARIKNWKIKSNKSLTAN
jgi:hypothetical protein